MDYYVETLFNSISFFDYSRNLLKDVEHEISIEEENYILNVGQEQYIEHLFDKFRLEPLKILEEDISQEVIEESVSNQDTLSSLSLPGVFGATKQEVVLFYIPVYGEIIN
ncbi:hypothetical protein BG31_08200 [Bacillus subtilis subsp. subtilis]|uniref:hypothetical protein n=1 Tax=Bacillus subtilis TaxID=1423 RepID=UPI000A343234|nr:hypothetical protein [Bacillus subtilis]MED1679198.1 hypothetical protein [Bacillus subtilis]OTQ88470.1 hypothetical protein BG31_08200 [Bacillus subtilis subsp. subtilis]